MRPARFEVSSAGRGPAILAAVLGGCLACGGAAVAGEVSISTIRHWTAPDHTRIVLDLSAPGAYEVRRVSDPERIVINVPHARFRYTVPLVVGDGVVRQVRRNQGNNRAQVVVDLAVVAAYRHFALPAAAERPARIVLDVFRPVAAASPSEAPAEVASRKALSATRDSTALLAADSVVAAPQAPAAVEGPAPLRAATDTPRPFTVVIDPGHGGMDPGAIREHLREKDLALDIAHEIARLINAIPGCRAVLTRSGDYFVSLAERVRIAQRSGGDLFLSIHCNTHRKREIAGMEVYFLSLQGATDREAQELADKENAADLVGLAPDEAQDDSVLSILMDLRMTRVLDHSSRLAEALLETARKSPIVDARKVKQARFQVLRSLAMPSALVEVAYLSNAADRRLLGSAEGRRKLARLVVDGVMNYRGDKAEPVIAATPQVWSLRYKVRSGDTLWRIAARHRTTVAEVRERNDLRSESIRIGQVLWLPAAD